MVGIYHPRCPGLRKVLCGHMLVSSVITIWTQFLKTRAFYATEDCLLPRRWLMYDGRFANDVPQNPPHYMMGSGFTQPRRTPGSRGRKGLGAPCKSLLKNQEISHWNFEGCTHIHTSKIRKNVLAMWSRKTLQGIGCHQDGWSGQQSGPPGAALGTTPRWDLSCSLQPSIPLATTLDGAAVIATGGLHWPRLHQQRSVAARWPHLHPHRTQFEPPVSTSKWQTPITPRTWKGGWEPWMFFLQPLQSRKARGGRRDRCRASHS